MIYRILNRRVLTAAGIAMALALAFSGGTLHADPAAGNWTWMQGASTVNQSGTYGTLGAPASANTPGARYEAVSWTDGSGALWLFGGYGKDGAGSSDHLNDLWKYDPATGNWTWMKGASTVNQSGVYGTPGVAATANTPGARRYFAVSWTDDSGVLWLFGGIGYDSAGSLGRLNDLWKYDPTTGNWTWMKGASTVNQSGVYGTLGTPDAANTPGARRGAISWIDGSGALWLSGGDGYDGAGNTGYLNDLWRYDPATGKWAWMKGPSTRNQPGVYGTQGMANASNTPGARWAANAWSCTSNTLWLFGGYGYDGAGSSGYLNDLWQYAPAAGNWTWMKGASTVGQSGVYGTLGSADAANTPGARQNGVSWTDGAGALWLFGGRAGNSGSLNDLWQYTPETGNWTWMQGASTFDQSGTYGTLGVTDAGSIPGARYRAVSWTDNSGAVWLFGGQGRDSAGDEGLLNDLWKYTESSAGPTPTNTPMATPTATPEATPTATPTATPEATSGFSDTQICRIDATGGFWCGVFNYTALDWVGSKEGDGPDTLSFPVVKQQWLGGFLYDYASGAYMAGFYVYTDDL